jgi:ribonuclease HI
MTPEVDVAFPYVRVTRKGLWSFYKAVENWKSTMTSGAYTISKHKEVKASYSNLGELDTRISTAALALSHPAPPWTALLSHLTPPVDTQNPSPIARRPTHLHWLFTEHLRTLIEATQYVGAPPTAASFGFSRIVHSPANPPLAFEELDKAASVVWLNGVKADRRRQVLWTLGNRSPVLMVVSSRVRVAIQKALQKAHKLPKYWKKVASFPAQTRLMLSTDQYDFRPKACSRALEVWANLRAHVRPGVLDISSFTMPDEPLRAINEMHGDRWDYFHLGAQDFTYRQAPGVLAATDGAVKKYGKDGVLMSGGVAYRAGAHGLVDTGLHVNGPISSFVAEGAALLFLLESAPPDEPLTILTDSANVMWAMQHCSRKEKIMDFSTHSNKDLLQRLCREHIRRTANTHYVKVTAHTSITLNERADSLATAARADKEAPS